jgi:transcriptional regulator with XRE-family HTH domain
MPELAGRGRLKEAAVAQAERSFAVRLGERLRWVRQQRSMSLRTVSQLSGEEFRISVLGAYERGHRMISVARLQRLAELYGVSVDHLLPQPEAKEEVGNGQPHLDRRASNRGSNSKVTLDLRRLAGLPPEAREVLGRYLGLIQMERQDDSGFLISIRPEDLRAIACLVESTSAKAKAKLDELTVDDG